MAFFLVQAAYESSAKAALAQNPEDREKTFRQLIEKAGGKLQTMFFAFGEDDVVAIFEAPDNATALTIGMACGSAGHLRSYRTTALMTSEEAVAAMKRAGKLSYKAPRAAA